MILHFDQLQKVTMKLNCRVIDLFHCQRKSQQSLIDTGMWSLVFKHMKTYKVKYKAEKQKHSMYRLWRNRVLKIVIDLIPVFKHIQRLKESLMLN